VRRYARDEGGQALPLIAAAIAALILGIGLAMDTGELFVARRAMQTAADAAAWAGATVLYAGGNAATAQTAATTDATRNGYSVDSWTTITATSPPTTGVTTGDPGYIEVSITRLVETKLIPGGSSGRTSVSVRAVAGIARSGTGDAILVLHPTAASALNVSGNARVTITGGGTQTNSTSGTAVNVSGGSTLTGTYHRVRGSTSGGTAGRMTPAPVTGASVVNDPFASMSGPPTTGVPTFPGQVITTPVTLSPGLYTGTIAVGSGGVASLNSGTYIFQQGLVTAGTASLVLASSGGVLLYNTYSNYPAAPGGSPTCVGMSLAGTGQHTLAAKTTGSYAGMVIFQDRNCTNAAGITLRAAATSLSGTMYFPQATLTATLAGNSTISSQIVARQLSFTGNFTLNSNFTSSAITGTRVPALVE